MRSSFPVQFVGIGFNFFRTFLFLHRVWVLRHLRLEGFLVGSARVLFSKFDTRSVQSFISNFFSNFSVLQRDWVLRHLWKVFLWEVPESCVEIRHAILAKFHKPFFFELFCSCKGFETVLLKPQPVSFFSNAWELPISVAATVLGSREVDQRVL